MTAKAEKKESTTPEKAPEITFKCRFCEEAKPYSEMMILPRFFPPLAACRSCALRLEYKAEEQIQEEEKDAHL